jgi:hypothetical protein
MVCTKESKGMVTGQPGLVCGENTRMPRRHAWVTAARSPKALTARLKRQLAQCCGRTSNVEPCHQISVDIPEGSKNKKHSSRTWRSTGCTREHSTRKTTCWARGEETVTFRKKSGEIQASRMHVAEVSSVAHKGDEL